jgi:cytochrome c
MNIPVVTVIVVAVLAALGIALYGFSPATLPGQVSLADLPSIGTQLAGADPAAGRAFAQHACGSCHSFDKGGNARLGPNLYGVTGATKATHPHYTYSDALQAKGGVWSDDDLNHFLYHPRAYVPGSKMYFGGIRDDKDRANVIAWLHTLRNDSGDQSPSGPLAK